MNVVSYWQEALAVVLVLGGLIFFHELGHFLMARVLGIGVRTFSLGFGPKLVTVCRGKTEYCLSLVPLGGYVSLAGEEGEEEQDEKKQDEIQDRSEKTPEPASKSTQDEIVFTTEEKFSSRPAWQRLLVVFAGPVANFLLAFLLYWGLAWGQGQSYLLPEIGKVVEDSPAAAAGLVPGDMIVSIDDVMIREWRQVPEAISAAKGSEITLVVLRDGTRQQFRLRPKAGTVSNIFGERQETWLIGIGSGTGTATIPLGPVQAFVAGLNKTREMTAFTCESIVKLFQRVVPLDNVGGPILIAQMIGQQTEQGMSAVLLLAALISINLGILNLLPVPVLDGGHIIFFLLEMLIGRPVSMRIRSVSTQIGMVLLLALMLFATWNDLTRLFS